MCSTRLCKKNFEIFPFCAVKFRFLVFRIFQRQLRLYLNRKPSCRRDIFYPPHSALHACTKKIRKSPLKSDTILNFRFLPPSGPYRACPLTEPGLAMLHSYINFLCSIRLHKKIFQKTLHNDKISNFRFFASSDPVLAPIVPNR